MRLYIQNDDHEIEDENREVVRRICESILEKLNSDPTDPTRQLYALQRLVELKPVAETLFCLQHLCTKIYKKYRFTPLKRKLQIYAAVKKAFASFKKDGVEDLSCVLSQASEGSDLHGIEPLLHRFNTFSQEQRAEAAELFARPMRLALQNPRPQEGLMKCLNMDNRTWKLKIAQDLFPFDPVSAERVLLDIAHHSKDKVHGYDSDERGAAFLLMMFNRGESARKAYTLIALNVNALQYDRLYAQSWLEADDAVTLFTDLSSPNQQLSLEFTYLLNNFEYEYWNREALGSKTFLHTQNARQRQTAKEKLQLLNLPLQRSGF